ncbi:ABC transporter substrate-binding protein [Agrobacterium sp. NPDC089420]|uniref:ABC transporter substrate-binding protein n=1 Tax=Agrobacterium sp. NPDC089420 TaxID=3363918 RepID=UPI00384E4F49
MSHRFSTNSIGNVARIVAASLGLAAVPFVSSAMAQTSLSMWYHGSGNQAESAVVNQIIDDFNKSQSDWAVKLQSFPTGAYNDAVVAGALAGSLPDILDVDGPNMPNWAWAGYMQPLSIDQDAVKNFLPGTKGIWDGKLYSVGLFDATISLVSRKSILDQLGLRLPTLDKPWTKDEFMAALKAAKTSGKYSFALDLATQNNSGGWYAYGYTPLLWSFGGDLVDRKTYLTAEGALNGEGAMAFGDWFQGLFKDGYAEADQAQADREAGFAKGRYAFSWQGSGTALRALEAFNDTVFLPAPDFGHGAKVGAGSWQFGASKSSKHPDGVAAFIKFALQDKYLAAFSDATGLIPATPSAAAQTKNFREGGPLAQFFEFSNRQGMVRPITPGFAVQAVVFRKAMGDIAHGANVADTLDAAVDEINADIERNRGYGHK